MQKLPPSLKQNVQKFDEDIRDIGGYAYTGASVSARLANERISRSIAESIDFSNISVLDIGCGDGAYTVAFPSFGIQKVVGIDPAGEAIKVARGKAKALGVSDIVSFEVGDIYDIDKYLTSGYFDCIVLRGVLHHLPDPARAIAGLSSFEGLVIVLEPNGNNPILKLLERFSRYHIDHEEQSFSPKLICNWLNTAQLPVRSSKVLNLVPFFCPDWIARFCRKIEPIIERIPFLRDVACGQSIIVAGK